MSDAEKKRLPENNYVIWPRKDLAGKGGGKSSRGSASPRGMRSVRTGKVIKQRKIWE